MAGRESYGELEGHAGGWDVAIFEGGEVFSGFADGLDGGGVGGGVLAENLENSLVEDGPGFEFEGDIGWIVGFDEVDFVSGVLLGAWDRVARVSAPDAKVVEIENFLFS